MTGSVTAFAYGTDNPSAAYVGTSTGELFLRTAGNRAPVRVPNYPGAGVKVDDIAVDRSDWQRAVIISGDGRLLFTTDAGGHWNNIRGNVGDVLVFMRKIEIVSVGTDVVILVAGDPPAGSSGIVRAINPDTRQPAPDVVWSPFGIGLPHVNVFDLRYCPPVMLRDGSPGGDLLIAGTLGRGAWTVADATLPAIVPNCVSLTEDAAIQALTAALLQLGTTRVLPPRPGTTPLTPLRVVDQSPEPGAEVDRHSAVNLTLQKYLFSPPHH
jgi:hypothetical protein